MTARWTPVPWIASSTAPVRALGWLQPEFRVPVLEGTEQTGRYWDATFPPEHRHDWCGRGCCGPLVIIPLAHKQAYLDHFAEPGALRC
jgi:hypothetical protein